MASYNHIALLGTIENLNNKTLPSGINIIEFTLVANDSYINKAGEKVAKKVEITVVFMGAFATKFERPLQNGEKIIVEGKLQSNSKESNGTKRVWYSIIGQAVTFLTENGQKATQSAPDNGQKSNQSVEFKDEFPF